MLHLHYSAQNSLTNETSILCFTYLIHDKNLPVIPGTNTGLSTPHIFKAASKNGYLFIVHGLQLFTMKFGNACISTCSYPKAVELRSNANNVAYKLSQCLTQVCVCVYVCMAVTSSYHQIDLLR